MPIEPGTIPSFYCRLNGSGWIIAYAKKTSNFLSDIKYRIMKSLTNIGRLFQGVHRAMGFDGNPDDKIKEILAVNDKELWGRISGESAFSLSEIECIASYFSLTSEALMLLGDGIMSMVPKVCRALQPGRVKLRVTGGTSETGGEPKRA